MSRQIEIVTNTGKALVWTYGELNGLAITQTIPLSRRDWKLEDGYVITHINTGLTVATGFHSLDNAISATAWLTANQSWDFPNLSADVRFGMAAVGYLRSLANIAKEEWGYKAEEEGEVDEECVDYCPECGREYDEY